MPLRPFRRRSDAPDEIRNVERRYERRRELADGVAAWKRAELQSRGVPGTENARDYLLKAERHLRRSIIDPPDRDSLIAGLYLGRVRAGLGDREEAESILVSLRARDEVRNEAAIFLAECLVDWDRQDDAATLLRSVAGGSWKGRELLARARVWRRLGEAGEAADAYSKALRALEFADAARAGIELAEVQLEEGDLGGAEATYEHTIGLGDAEWSPEAALRLGDLLSERDPARATAAYELAINAGHEEASPRAAFTLGQQARTAGRRDDARQLFDLVAESAHATLAPKAKVLSAMLGKNERVSQAGAAPESRAADRRVFISHASEDKDLLVRDLADELGARGWTVWYDEQTLEIGDSLSGRIDDGLANARFAIVVLSRSFFAKSWPRAELDALINLATARRGAMILPVWHGVDHSEVGGYSPLLAAHLAGTSKGGPAALADQLSSAMDTHLQRERSGD